MIEPVPDTEIVHYWAGDFRAVVRETLHLFWKALFPVQRKRWKRFDKRLRWALFVCRCPYKLWRNNRGVPFVCYRRNTHEERLTGASQ